MRSQPEAANYLTPSYAPRATDAPDVSGTDLSARTQDCAVTSYFSEAGGYR
jgi:hypothetical protein